jgi:hypothetical protein
LKECAVVIGRLECLAGIHHACRDGMVLKLCGGSDGHNRSKFCEDFLAGSHINNSCVFTSHEVTVLSVLTKMESCLNLKFGQG